MFDIVRFVDPAARHILFLNEDGTISIEEYFCYKVWNKIDRCENCISVKAQCSGRRGSKYEFVNDEVFQVVATPFVIHTTDGKTVTAVLELVNNSTDEIVFEAFGKAELIEKINGINRRIYEDSLTQVHNRRYFDERVFCYAGGSNLRKNVAFVMADLKKFKTINDTYGHEAGDHVLAATGEAMKSCVRSADAVIRMGGDEFLVVLRECPQERVPAIVEKMRVALGKVVYDREKDLHAVADFGWSFTPNFDPTDDCISQLLGAVDEKMYANKGASSR